jgi:hypothetical protein
VRFSGSGLVRLDSRNTDVMAGVGWRVPRSGLAGSGSFLRLHRLPGGAQRSCRRASPPALQSSRALLRHRSVTSKRVYTALAPNRFKDFWRG